MDCVHQLLELYPEYFEFTSRFLVCLADHSTSGRFDSLLWNTEKELKERGGKECLWTYLKLRRKRFLNPLFRHDQVVEKEEEEEEEENKLMIPSRATIATKIRLWDLFFLRWVPGIIIVNSSSSSSSSFSFSADGKVAEDECFESDEDRRSVVLKRISRTLMTPVPGFEDDDDDETPRKLLSKEDKKLDSRSEKYGVEWEADEDRNECSVCRAEFHLLRRRHHCRKCGQIVCNACSKWRERVTTFDGKVKKGKRVCDRCRGGT